MLTVLPLDVIVTKQLLQEFVANLSEVSVFQKSHFCSFLSVVG